MKVFIEVNLDTRCVLVEVDGNTIETMDLPPDFDFGHDVEVQFYGLDGCFSLLPIH